MTTTPDSAVAASHIALETPDAGVEPEVAHNMPAQYDKRTDGAPDAGIQTRTPPSSEKVRKLQRHHTMPGSDNTVVNVINSTKIIIKGLNVNAAAAAAAAAKSDAADAVVASTPPQQSTVDETSFTPNISDVVHEKANNTSIAVEADQLDDTADSAPPTAIVRTATPKINRECMLLQRTVNESKMLTEYMNDTDSRARKAKRASTIAAQRLAADDASDNESGVSSRGGGGSRAADRSRSRSRSRNHSPGSSDGKGPRRSNMRSQNAEFSAKHQKFLMGIQQHHQHDSEASDNSDHELEGGRSLMLIDVTTIGGDDADGTNGSHVAPKPGSDFFCWSCLRTEPSLACTTCKRSFHPSCLKVKNTPLTSDAIITWRCVECHSGEPSDADGATNKRSKTKYTKDELCTMLKFAVKRCQMVNTNKSIEFPRHPETIVNEMNLAILDARINAKSYATTVAFTSDVKWIVHNCLVGGNRNTKQLVAAKNILKTVKQEMYDIETCPECYYNANTRKHDWFEEVCTRPHILLWAKLKGFPFWPAKAMGTNAAMVDVRFFGEHDRAWVPVRDCYLFSKEDPNPPNYKYKRNSIVESLKEVDVYIKNITIKFGSFEFAQRKTTYNPEAEDEQLELLIPKIRTYLEPQASSSVRSDLTFKIVKTADNSMSIVKKSDASSPSNSSSNGSTSTVTLSLGNQKDTAAAAPTQSTVHAQVSSLSKSLNINPRVMVSKDTSTQRYQVMHRDSVDNSSNSPGHVDDGKVKAVILKRKSMSCTSIRKRIRTPSNETLEEKEKPTKIASEPILAGSATDCVDELSQITPENEESDVKDSSTDSSLLQTSTEELVSPSQPPTLTVAGYPDEASMFVPMMEVKHELVDDDEPITLSSSRSSLIASGVKNDSSDVKLEPMSEDDELDGDDILTETTLTPIPKLSVATPTSTSAQAASSIVYRGHISVKDMAKLQKPPLLAARKQPEPQPQTTLLKKVFKRAQAKDTNVQKPITITRTSLPAQAPSNFNSMVYIPMADGKQFAKNDSLVSKPKDQVTNNKNFLKNARINANVSQPPPLTSVSAGTPTIQTIASANSSGVPPVVQQQQQQLYLHQQSPHIITNTPTTMHYISASCPPPLVASLSSAAAGPANIGQHCVLIQSQAASAPPLSSSPQSRHFLGDMVPENLARAVTDTLTRGTPPRLVAKPTGALRSDGVTNATNVDAGPVSKMLIDNSHKLADFFRSVIEDTLADMSGTTACSTGNSLEARNKLLQLENERLRAEHASEIEKLRTNTDQILREMQRSLENEKVRLVAETRQQCVAERIRSVEETKKKQWCVQCGKEAQFYCCWNTSYCDYPCQQQHWTRHMPKCAQQTEHHNGLVYGNGPAPKVAVVDKGVSATITAKPNFKVAAAVHKTKAVAAQPRTNATAAAKAQQTRVISLQQIPIQPSPTAFTLVNRPVNCVMVSSASTLPSIAHIPHNSVVNTYAATPPSGSLLISSAASLAGNDHILRVVSNQ